MGIGPWEWDGDGNSHRIGNGNGNGNGRQWECKKPFPHTSTISHPRAPPKRCASGARYLRWLLRRSCPSWLIHHVHSWRNKMLLLQRSVKGWERAPVTMHIPRNPDVDDRHKMPGHLSSVVCDESETSCWWSETSWRLVVDRWTDRQSRVGDRRIRTVTGGSQPVLLLADGKCCVSGP